MNKEKISFDKKYFIYLLNSIHLITPQIFFNKMTILVNEINFIIENIPNYFL